MGIFLKTFCLKGANTIRFWACNHQLFNLSLLGSSQNFPEGRESRFENKPAIDTSTFIGTSISASREVFKGLVNLSTCYDTHVLSFFFSKDIIRLRYRLADLEDAREYICVKTYIFWLNWGMSLPNVDYWVITWRDRVWHEESDWVLFAEFRISQHSHDSP